MHHSSSSSGGTCAPTSPSAYATEEVIATRGSVSVPSRSKRTLSKRATLCDAAHHFENVVAGDRFGLLRPLAQLGVAHLPGLRSLREVHQRNLDGGLVDHLAALGIRHRAAALLMVELHHAARLVDLLLARRVARVRDLGLLRMNDPRPI